LGRFATQPRVLPPSPGAHRRPRWRRGPPRPAYLARTTGPADWGHRPGPRGTGRRPGPTLRWPRPRSGQWRLRDLLASRPAEREQLVPPRGEQLVEPLARGRADREHPEGVR